MNLLTDGKKKLVSLFGAQQLQYWKCYIPLLGVALPRNLNTFVALYLAKRLHTDSVITGIGIGQMTLYCALTSSLMGFSLIFESYAGTIKSSIYPNKLGELLIKCILQGVAAFLLVLGPFLNLVHVVSLIGTDTQTHAVAGQCMRAGCLAPLFSHIQELLVKYLVIQGYVKTPLIVGISGMVFTASLSYLFVEVLQWGVLGFAFAFSLAPLLVAVGAALFCAHHKDCMLWNGFSSDIWRGWKEMMVLGAFNSARILSGSCIYILANFICQVLGSVGAATVIVVDQINLIFNVFVYTDASATAFILGMALGRRNYTEVKMAMVIGVINWAMERAASLLIMFLFARSIAAIFTDTESVLNGVENAEVSMALLYLLFGLDELLAQGFLTPLGRQTLIGIVATLSIFLVGYPMMFAMVYLTDTGAPGIYWCFVASYSVQALVYVGRLCCIDIPDEIELCEQRIGRGFHHGSRSADQEAEIGPTSFGTFNTERETPKFSDTTSDMLVEAGGGRSYLSSRARLSLAVSLSICYVVTTVSLSFL